MLSVHRRTLFKAVALKGSSVHGSFRKDNPCEVIFDTENFEKLGYL